MVKMFPVGLGLKNILISGIIISLLFGLLIFSLHFKKTKWPVKITGVLALFFFGFATYQSGFNIHQKKPNSIVYIQNNTNQQAYFGTYNKTLDNFTKPVFNDEKVKGSIQNAETKSKYNTRFTYHITTENRNIEFSKIKYLLDTIIREYRYIEVVFKPQNKVNKFEFITQNQIELEQFKVNDALVAKGEKYTKKAGTFLIYHMANTDKEITLSFKTKNKEKIPVVINQISYDLLQHPQFDIKQRTNEMMPMPFVTNDAIIVTKEIDL
ncbi:MAG: hypothetical protein HC798_02985 [Polaribacter sp.]|nr:hypothetical protein [Polaribacter sp.]